MARTIITGIDVGTHQIKVVVAESVRENGRQFPRILGVGSSESRGLRHGYIISQSEVVESLREAISQAENSAGIKIKKAFISIGGIGLSSVISHGSVITSRADSEITPLDIKKVTDLAQTEIPHATALNKKVLHDIPLQYKIDGKLVFGKPEGLKGTKLEAKVLFITCLEHHLNDLIQAFDEAGVEVQDVMASPIAASFVTLNKSQKIAGCVLTNIGAETVSIAVFENNIPVSLEVFPIGSTDITNDIALGLKVPLEEAEQLKIGTLSGTSYPRRKLEEIITARLSDVFELIETHLKKIGRNGLLPAGIIISGGGANINGIDDLARSSLKLPSKIATLNFIPNAKEHIKDATWSVAYGLCIFGYSADGSESIRTGMRFVHGARRSFMSWVKQFLP